LRLSIGRVARWFVFKPKIPISEKFSVPQVGKCWYILWPFGIFCDHSVHIVLIWYILFLFWYHAPRKIWRPWV
jgi:hypothetical protein